MRRRRPRRARTPESRRLIPSGIVLQPAPPTLVVDEVNTQLGLVPPRRAVADPYEAFQPIDWLPPQVLDLDAFQINDDTAGLVTLIDASLSAAGILTVKANVPLTTGELYYNGNDTYLATALPQARIAPFRVAY